MTGIKLIVADLDNTLLRRDKTISDYTADVFRRLRERGMLTAFATARDFRFVTEYISPEFGITPDIVIADNGALARLRDRDLYRRLIPADAANELLAYFNPVRCVSTESAYYLTGAYSNDHWSAGKKDTILIDSPSGVTGDVLYIDGNADTPAAAITERFPDVRAVTYSDVGLVTVVHREATKLNALLAVERELNIVTGEIAAFGDDYSDIEMLKHCGVGVAMANAIDECKTAADYICGDCDDDGVARWLEENVLFKE